MGKKLAPWLATICMCVAGVLVVMKPLTSGYDDGTLPGLILGLLTVILLFLVIGTRNRSRSHLLEQDHPDAFVCTVVAYPELKQELLKASIAAGIALPALRMTSLSVSINANEIRFYGGLWNPKEVFRLPTSQLQDVRIEKRSQNRGKWLLDLIELTFNFAREPSATVDLCVIQGRWGLPLVAKRPQLEAALQRIRDLMPKLPSSV